MMESTNPTALRRRRNRPSRRALEVLRRARETAAAAAQAAAEAAELLRRSRRWRRRRPSWVRKGTSKSLAVGQPQVTSTNAEQSSVSNIRKLEEPNGIKQEEFKRRRPPGYWARKRERRRQRRAEEAAAGGYYGPRDMQMNPFDCPQEFYPDDCPPGPPDYEMCDWPGAHDYPPPPPGPSFEFYPIDRMQPPMERRDYEYYIPPRPMMVAEQGRGSSRLRVPQGVRHFPAPATSEPWNRPAHPYDARWY